MVNHQMFRYNDWNEKIPHHGEATFLGGCFSKSCKSSTFQRISKGEASFAREDYHVSSPLLGTRFAFGRSLSRRSPVMMKKNLMSHSSYWPHAWTWVMRNCLNGKIVSMVFWGGSNPLHRWWHTVRIHKVFKHILGVVFAASSYIIS